MPREPYQRRIDELSADVSETGALIVGRIEAARKTLETGNVELAREVIGDEITTTYLDSERDAVDLYSLCQCASQQSVRTLVERAHSVDLWGIDQLPGDSSVLLPTVRDVGRTGNHGVNIAARTPYMSESDTGLLC